MRPSAPFDLITVAVGIVCAMDAMPGSSRGEDRVEEGFYWL